MSKLLALSILLAGVSYGATALASDEDMSKVKVEVLEFEDMGDFVEFYSGSVSHFELSPYESGEECRGASWDDLQEVLDSDKNNKVQIKVSTCGDNAFICLDINEYLLLTPDVCGTFRW